VSGIRAAVSLLAGAVVGAILSGVYRTQLRLPAHYVAELEPTSGDASVIGEYVLLVERTLVPFGGRFLIRGDNTRNASEAKQSWIAVGNSRS
jgi:hypothetical protein